MTPDQSLRRRFARDTRGVSAVIFALCLVPAIGVVSLGVDYTRALARKARLDAAADAAALAAIGAAKDYVSAHALAEVDPWLTDHAKAAGKTLGDSTFKIDAGADIAGLTAAAVTNVDRSGQTFTAMVSYAATSPTSFGGMFGTQSFTVGGTASSSLTMGAYLDFYLALDVSGSMGLPTSSDGQANLQKVNGGCQFACHFPGNSAGYNAARKNNIKLRVDSVGTAVAHLVQTATATKTLLNQYRVGAYPFVNDVMEAAPLAYDVTAAALVGVTLGDGWLDAGLSTPNSQAMHSGGTHFENLLPEMNNFIKQTGDGSSPLLPKPFLFIVTDGMDNNQAYNPGFNGSQPREPNNFGTCAQTKARGITVAILYIPYQKLLNPTPGETAESNQVNALIDKVKPDLTACASPGFIFTADTDADIDAALQAMFQQALKAARLVR